MEGLTRQPFISILLSILVICPRRTEIEFFLKGTEKVPSRRGGHQWPSQRDPYESRVI